jgi:tRNA-modifying protein YgfZ
MHKSPLDQTTAACGSRLVACHGFTMPADYGDPATEYAQARQGVVLRDASHLGLLRLSGADHLDFLHRMSTNDFNNATVDQAVEAVLPDSRGRILELGVFYRLDSTSTLAVLGPNGQSEVPTWLDRYLFSESVEFTPLNGQFALLEIAGPQAADAVAAITAIAPEQSPDLSLVKRDGDLEIWRHDQWGHCGLRAFGPAAAVAALWTELHAAGAIPLGESASESLRLEHGQPAKGSELTDAHNPWEANLGRTVHMNKGCYIGQEVIARLDTYDKTKQKLCGLFLPDGPLPASASLLKADDRDAGRLSSAVFSYGLNRNIGLAYVRRDWCTPGAKLQLVADTGTVEGAVEVAELPLSVSV